MDRGCNFLSSHKSTKEVLKKSLLVTFPSLLTLDKCHTFFSSSFTSFCIFPSNTADPSWKHIQLKINFNLLKATEENWNLRKMKFYQVVKKTWKSLLFGGVCLSLMYSICFHISKGAGLKFYTSSQISLLLQNSKKRILIHLLFCYFLFYWLPFANSLIIITLKGNFFDNLLIAQLFHISSKLWYHFFYTNPLSLFYLTIHFHFSH